MLPAIRQTQIYNQAINAPLASPSGPRTCIQASHDRQHLGPLAAHLNQVRNLTLHNLDAKLKATLTNAQYKTLEPLLNDIEEASPTLASEVMQFVKANHDSPALMEALLKTLNTTCLIVKAKEQQLKGQARSLGLPRDLNVSLSALVQGAAAPTDSLADTLSNLTISPVLTAHPTSVQKPEVSALLLKHIEQADTTNGNQALCDELWPLMGVRTERPSVNEEAKHLSAYAPNIYKAAQTVHRTVQQTLGEASEQLLALPNPLIELGNWAGGDRDGNPNINAKVLRSVVVQYAKTAFDCLDEALSGNDDTKPSPLGQLLIQAGQQDALTTIHSRLSRTRAHVLNEQALPIQGDLYLSPQDLVDDLGSVDVSKLSPSDQAIWQSELNLFRLTAHSVGFHGASTDIRQNSAMNEKTVGELIRRSGGPANYELLNEAEKTNLLHAILTGAAPFELNPKPLINEPDHCEFHREIELIQSYKTIHDTFGPKALQNCITANTETVSDMLEVMVLLKYAGLAENNTLAMNVVPLIETVDDLHNGPAILNGMLSNPWYRDCLCHSKNTQQIMVGYSDSNRLDGPLCSSWAVYDGTAKMVAIAKAHGVNLHVFHGRGGTEARGSGDSYGQEIRATNPASLRTGKRQTEQGEEVLSKFGTPETALGNLADKVVSTLAMVGEKDDVLIAKYASTMHELADLARNTYATLYQDPDLPAFVKASTPIDFMGSSNAGSRPASRANSPDGALNLSKLRAIPWVASWNQSGMGMPAFYGTGSAIQNYIEAPGTPKDRQTRVETLQTMYREWPFFTAFVDRTDAALSKTDMSMAENYASLAPKHTTHIFDKIRQECELTKTQLQTIRGSMPTLGRNPDTAEVIEVIKPLTAASRATQACLMDIHQSAGESRKAAIKPLITLSILANASGDRLG
jgi:phosphoenolpyruvate carboxylase